MRREKLWEQCLLRVLRCKSVEVEVLACHRALEFAIDIGFSKLMIEGDSAQALNSIWSNDANQSRLGHVIVDI